MRRRNEKPVMHNAVCDDCGDDCKVPFKPSGGKPIYCSRCFEKYDDGPREKRGGRREYRRDNRHDTKTLFSAVCDKCGKDCRVPFKPNPDKPIYCSACFDEKDSSQLEGIHKKLDMILAILESRE